MVNCLVGGFYIFIYVILFIANVSYNQIFSLSWIKFQINYWKNLSMARHNFKRNRCKILWNLNIKTFISYSLGHLRREIFTFFIYSIYFNCLYHDIIRIFFFNVYKTHKLSIESRIKHTWRDCFFLTWLKIIYFLN